uniref:EF-hand domain-containing protein n=1 Tax=Syphacia muris TaxID=451379 RepID=A0A0N5AMA2_9BILA
TQYFSQQQIDEYRQCFYLYCQDGVVQNASQLRYIMRCLGYCSTTSETVTYFEKHGKKIDFATFLEILHEESQQPNPIDEIMAALNGIDRKKRGWITTNEFINILSSVGDHTPRKELEYPIKYLDPNSTGCITFSKLRKFLNDVL